MLWYRFRWAYCQLQELKKLKSTKPKYIRAALSTIPATLDATYERMLIGIGELYQEEALVLLRWSAYAQSPLSLHELAEAAQALRLSTTLKSKELLTS